MKTYSVGDVTQPWPASMSFWIVVAEEKVMCANGGDFVAHCLGLWAAT